MDNYDPNFCKGVHTVKITFQMWDYKGYITTNLGGNCKGSSILNSFVDMEYFDDELIVENECSLKIVENIDGKWWYEIKLTNSNGKEMHHEDEVRYLNDIIVSVEIIDYREE